MGEEDRKQQLEDASRQERTVMVAGLSIKADERDIFEFFTPIAGKVRDVQVIRDARTGRSKGVSYVEFASHESMAKALGMNGRNLKGHGVRVSTTHSLGGGGAGGGTHASSGVAYKTI